MSSQTRSTTRSAIRLPCLQTLNLALHEHRVLDRDQERHVAALDRALRVPLPEPVIAYRGVELEHPVDFTARAGHPSCFVLSSPPPLLRPIAEGFCALASTKNRAVLFETLLEAGTRVGCPDLVQPTLEAELLLLRRQPSLLGQALPPAPGRRYWTVKLQATKWPLLDESTTGAQHRAHRRLSDRRPAAARAPPAVTRGPRPLIAPLTPPSHVPSIGR